MNGIVRRTQAEIIVKNHDAKPVFTWTLTGVIPVRWTGPSLSVDSPKVATETLELAHHGFLEPGVVADMALRRTSLAKAQLDLREPRQGDKRLQAGRPARRAEVRLQPQGLLDVARAALELQGQPKKAGEHAEFTGTEPRTLDVEMFLDATDELTGDVSKTIDSCCARCGRPRSR